MQYDFYPAGEDCLLILTGLGGTTKGYDGKYEKMAKNINLKYNCSVAVVAVPNSCWDNPKQVFLQAIDCVYASIPPKRLFVFGNSAGGTIALWYAFMFPGIDKVMSVNPVLNLNYHNAKNGLQNFAGSKMYIISGEFDGGAQWIKFLPEKQNVFKNVFAGADHAFTNMLDEFISLPEILFETT